MGIFDEPNIEELKASKNVKGLIEALKYEYSYIKRDIVEALVKIGEPAVKPLIDALKDANDYYYRRDKVDYFRRDIVEALVKIGEPAVKPFVFYNRKMYQISIENCTTY